MPEIVELNGMTINLVESKDVYSQMTPNPDELYFVNEPLVTLGSVSLSATWSDADPIFSQSVTVQNASTNSKIDLQPDETLLQAMIADGVTALWIENNNGVLTAKCLGAALSAAHTVQCTITEVG